MTAQQTTAQETTAQAARDAGWYDDPLNNANIRYWDGRALDAPNRGQSRPARANR